MLGIPGLNDNRIKGLFANAKKQNKKDYQKWLDMCHANGVTATNRIQEYMAQDLQGASAMPPAKMKPPERPQVNPTQAKETLTMADALVELALRDRARDIKEADRDLETKQRYEIQPAEQHLQELTANIESAAAELNTIADAIEKAQAELKDARARHAQTEKELMEMLEMIAAGRAGEISPEEASKALGKPEKKDGNTRKPAR